MATDLPLADEFLCVRCARHMKTCCQTSEVYATTGDVKRIAAHTSQQDFTEFRQPADPVYLEQDDDPLWLQHVFRSDGTRRVLRRQPNGDCTFLGQAGCVLPLEIRPLICRLYPYDYTAGGLRNQLAKGCPVELLSQGEGLLQALDIREDDARRWHQQLYQEIQLENDEDRTG